MKMKPKYKYKITVDDSAMSEIAIDMANPIPTAILPEEIPVDIINPEGDIALAVSNEIDKDMCLELSTKLQNLINLVGEELYVILEKNRAEGEYLATKDVAFKLDFVYEQLKLVNQGDLPSLDCALLDILDIANHYSIEIPEDLCYNSVYKVEFNDAMDYESKEGSIKRAEDIDADKKITKASITRKLLPEIKNDIWNGITTFEDLISFIETLDQDNKNVTSFLSELKRLDFTGKSKDYINKLLHRIVERLKAL